MDATKQASPKEIDLALEIEVLRAEQAYLQTAPLTFEDFKQSVLEGVAIKQQETTQAVRDSLVRKARVNTNPSGVPSGQVRGATALVEHVESRIAGWYGDVLFALLPASLIREQLSGLLDAIRPQWDTGEDSGPPYAERKMRLADIDKEIDARRATLSALTHHQNSEDQA